MASESASISLGVVLGNTSMKHGSASAAMITGALEDAQPYSGGSGVVQSSDGENLRSKLPRAEVPLGTLSQDGKTVFINPYWYRFFDFVANVQLGGPDAPTVTDLSSATISTRQQAIDATTAVASVSTQVDANAQALAATVQVAQSNALSGASQIPPVVFTASTKGQEVR